MSGEGGGGSRTLWSYIWISRQFRRPSFLVSGFAVLVLTTVYRSSHLLFARSVNSKQIYASLDILLSWSGYCPHHSLIMLQLDRHVHRTITYTFIYVTWSCTLDPRSVYSTDTMQRWAKWWSTTLYLYINLRHVMSATAFTLKKKLGSRGYTFFLRTLEKSRHRPRCFFT